MSNLNALATKVGYTDFKTMVKTAEGSATALKNGSAFGNTTVNFGTYTKKTGGTADLTWAPIYLARDDDGNAIMTLWLARSENSNTSSDQEVSQWGSGTYSSSNVNPPSNNYDTSYIRAVTLNIGSSYATAYSGSSAPTMVTPTPTTTNKFADFTVGDLRQYLTVPNKVAVQRTSTFDDRGELTYSKGYYTHQWGNDPIWLPSRKDIGCGASSPHFSVSSTQGANTINTWLRTGGGGAYHDIIYLRSAGSYSSSAYYTNPSATYGVRPAIHLNLTKILSEFVDAPTVQGTYTYNSAAQTINFNGFDTVKMEITGIARTGGTAYDAATFTATSATITDAGEYEITFKSKLMTGSTTKRWAFSDSGTDTTKVKVTVNKYKLETPGMGTKSITYTGEPIIFTANNYITTACTLFGSNPPPRNPMSVTVAKTGGWGANESASTNPLNNRSVEIGVRNAGEYKATFTITETDNYEWKDAGAKEITFTVEKKKLSVVYVTDPAGGTLSWSADDTTNTATFTISGIYAGDGASTSADIVNLQAKITKDEDTTYSLTKPLTDNADGTQEFVLDASVFGGAYVPGHYPITFEFYGGVHDDNYDLTNVINTMNNEKFVVGASGAGLNRYDWKYRTDDTALTPMPTDGTH
ncbi:MAG: hypothetical protein K2L87_06600, partial [Clostridiales bacterium]|nr:hypothetical protein [Clostridiales bacterium]